MYQSRTWKISNLPPFFQSTSTVTIVEMFNSIIVLEKAWWVTGTHNSSFASDKEKEFYPLVFEKRDTLMTGTLLLHNYIQPLLFEKGQKLLTKRQVDCLRWLMEGFSSKQISFKMRIQEDTVNEHIQEAKRRLNVSNRVEAVVKALKLKILEL